MAFRAFSLATLVVLAFWKIFLAIRLKGRYFVAVSRDLFYAAVPEQGRMRA
jgi:hypothetical protein